ncbi:MAG: secondary thiamine-phosphate synthase enzyme YjbQ [Deltaproteobacteria bacterium]|nr:secondary thiamine-phosphate synthase enzyme YjbQ [Deltaproteobacteria bacterium]
MEQIEIKTTEQCELLDITSGVENVVRKSGVKSGMCCVFVPHTTAGVTINENADPDVQHDIIMELNKIVPLRDNYRHAEGNSAAHIKSSIMGCSQEVIIEENSLKLGTWQSLFFCEFDGPRSRSVWVKVIGS